MIRSLLLEPFRFLTALLQTSLYSHLGTTLGQSWAKTATSLGRLPLLRSTLETRAASLPLESLWMEPKRTCLSGMGSLGLYSVSFSVPR